MLAGKPLPESANAELHGVSELLAALREAPVDPVERRGQARALDAYRETFARSHLSPQRRRRPAMLSTVLGAKLGAALAAGAVSLGGVAAAAYTGFLPAALQDLAHTTVGAPAADHGKSADHKPADHKPADHKPAASTTKTAVGPDAKGPATFGLCTAWAHVQDSGKAADKSVAFRKPSTHPGGKPTPLPSHSPSSSGTSHRP